MVIILMRKKTELFLAYCFLATAAVTIVGHDATVRRPLEKPTATIPVPAVVAPFPITRLADSPFLTSRSSEPENAGTAIAPQGAESGRSRQTRAAPLGVYFLRVAVHADSEGGHVTFGPGTQVRLVRHQAGKMRVTRNGTDFLVDESQLTNDLEAVAALAGTSS